MEIEREQHHEVVAVTTMASLVNRDETIGVAVKRETQIRASGANGQSKI